MTTVETTRPATEATPNTPAQSQLGGAVAIAVFGALLATEDPLS